jgi:hypothetical protein
MPFKPEEVLFLPTTDCNLNCPHCTVEKSKTVLSKSLAVKFLRDCNKNNIKKVGFTGGEPFLVGDLMLAVVREAVRQGMYFDRIMTNASWFRGEDELKISLSRLQAAGYDGSICVSVDTFHAQDIGKIALFIKTAISIFARKDVISIAYVDGDASPLMSLRGAKRRSNLLINATEEKLTILAKMLSGRLIGFGTTHPRIASKDIFIKIARIELSPVGRARHLKDPWDGKWFKEDHCKGPGNVFLVMPDGDVKPCCGYASDLKGLTIGNIGRDSVKSLIRNARRNKFVNAVFTKGLTSIRKDLESSGTKFPGKTSNHCFFCHHVLSNYSLFRSSSLTF